MPAQADMRDGGIIDSMASAVAKATPLSAAPPPETWSKDPQNST